MIFQDAIPIHSDDGTCNLYVHLHFVNTKKDIRSVAAYLQNTYHAIPVMPTMSYYIKAEHLPSKNSLDSFMDDFTVFLAESGFHRDEYDLAICPVRDILYLAADGSEIDCEE